MNLIGGKILAPKLTTDVVSPVDGRTWRGETEEHPEAFRELLQGTLPAVVRRTPRERHRAMLDKVLPGMMAQYRLTGKAEWPASLQHVLNLVAERDHNPKIAQAGGIEHVIEQGRALVRYISETGEMQQRAQDRKKVTLDWHGHWS